MKNLLLFAGRILLSTVFFLFSIAHAYSNADEKELLLKIPPQNVDSLQRLIDVTEGKEKLRLYRELVQAIGWTGEIADIEAVFNSYINEAKSQKEYEIASTAYTSYISALKNKNQFDNMDERRDEALEFIREHKYWKSYFFIYFTLIDVYNSHYEVEKASILMSKMYNEAKEVGYDPGIGMAAIWLAQKEANNNNHEAAERYISEAIEKLNKTENQYAYSIAYNKLANELIDQGKFDDARETLDVWEKSIKNSSIERDTTLYYYQLNMGRFLLYNEMGDIEKAQGSLNNMAKYLPYLPLVTDAQYHMLRTMFYLGQEDMENAIEALDKTIFYSIQTKQSLVVSGCLNLKAEVLSNMNRYEEAYNFVKESIHIKDSLDNEAAEYNLNELRTIYEVDKLTAEKEIHRQRWIMGIVACLLLLVVLLVYVFYSRRLKQRNQSLYQQIQELNRKEKAVETCFLSKPVETLNKEMLLYRRLSECMKAEKLFTDSDINRKKLADHLGTNESYLATAIRQGSGETFSDYISNLRLQFALELLNEQPDMTFEAIAEDSGHGSYSQFFRSFSKKYGISPSEYRKLAMKKS